MENLPEGMEPFDLEDFLESSSEKTSLNLAGELMGIKNPLLKLPIFPPIRYVAACIRNPESGEMSEPLIYAYTYENVLGQTLYEHTKNNAGELEVYEITREEARLAENWNGRLHKMWVRHGIGQKHALVLGREIGEIEE